MLGPFIILHFPMLLRFPYLRLGHLPSQKEAPHQLHLVTLAVHHIWKRRNDSLTFYGLGQMPSSEIIISQVLYMGQYSGWSLRQNLRSLWKV